MSQDITDIIKPIVICIMNKCLVCRLSYSSSILWLVNESDFNSQISSCAFFPESRILTELYVEKGYRCYGWYWYLK